MFNEVKLLKSVRKIKSDFNIYKLPGKIMLFLSKAAVLNFTKYLCIAAEVFSFIFWFHPDKSDILIDASGRITVKTSSWYNYPEYKDRGIGKKKEKKLDCNISRCYQTNESRSTKLQ